MKKISCLGLLLVCGIVLSGCSNGDTSKLEKQIDKISKSVDGLHERVDELSETGVDISSTKTAAESKTTDSKSNEKKETKDSKEKTTEKKELKDLYAKDAAVSSDTVKLQVTKVDFFENLPTHHNEDKGMVVVYYTIENTGSENIQPSIAAPKYIFVSEEDDVSDTRLTDSILGLSYYEKFKESYENSQLNIKPAAKIEATIAYFIKNEDKNIKVQIGSYEYTPKAEDSVASKTFTSKEIAAAYKKNTKVKPD